MPAPLIAVSLHKCDIRIQTGRAVTVRARPFRASARSRGNFTENPQDRQNTRRTAIHREVRPSSPTPPARSPRRVRALRRGQFAFKMRFRIANPWLDQPILGQLRSSVILVSKTKGPPFKFVISR